MPSRITVTRRADVPDPSRLALYRRAPELGPKILFFTGGTALRALSREIIRYTHNSIHVVTPFDSGGSSAVLRRAFHMPAVGDLRNRVMALADKSVGGNPPVFELFSHRFPKTGDQDRLRQRLDRIIAGESVLVKKILNPMRQIIRSHLRQFHHHMPETFDLRGACIGNLILTGGFLAHERHLDPVLYLFSKLVEARGEVCAVSNRDLHLVSELEDGTVLVGQHLLTGKETAPIRSAVQRVYLSESKTEPRPAPKHDRARATASSKRREKVHDCIGESIRSRYSADHSPAGKHRGERLRMAESIPARGCLDFSRGSGERNTMVGMINENERKGITSCTRSVTKIRTWSFDSNRTWWTTTHCLPSLGTSISRPSRKRACSPTRPDE